jgi:hypothetical protein
MTRQVCTEWERLTFAEVKDGQFVKRVGEMLVGADPSSGGPHVHPVSEVTDLQDALDSKASAVHNHDAAYAAIDHTHAATGAAWGGITGTLANQTDLQTALDAKAGTGHNHDAAYEAKNANIQLHIGSTSNPHSVTKAQSRTRAPKDRRTGTPLSGPMGKYRAPSCRRARVQIRGRM